MECLTCENEKKNRTQNEATPPPPTPLLSSTQLSLFCLLNEAFIIL